MSAPVRATVIAFGDRAVSTFAGESVGFDFNTTVALFLRETAGARITSINNTTQNSVRRTLESGLVAGQSTDEIATALEGVFDRAAAGRALTIARTEVNRASNFGTKEGYVQAGIQQKEWQATEDSVTRDSHAGMDGQVVDMDDDFESPDGGGADYPGDFGDASEDANCRCGVLPVISDRRVIWMTWKVLERLRSPHDKAVRVAMQKAFAAQRDTVLTHFHAVFGTGRRAA
jgi:SPP1 gp7 family putative phage head morphogenesis protein